jgi:hypothetical protein
MSKWAQDGMHQHNLECEDFRVLSKMWRAKFDGGVGAGPEEEALWDQMKTHWRTCTACLARTIAKRMEG